ncbi:LapA family protein [Aliiroseovarius sp. YM-037]|uniref:LapA family protein n=1 Tax=Aliiroseovarius sp. YM-037 TaxID=3341728 RepID=UPI003A80FB1F
MRYLRYAFLAALAICLITVALANRSIVELRLLPEEVSELLGMNAGIQLPLFIVIFGGIVAGLLIGFVWEWFREMKHRNEASRAKREAAKLSREVSRLREDKSAPEDDVLRLLEDGGATR